MEIVGSQERIDLLDLTVKSTLLEPGLKCVRWEDNLVGYIKGSYGRYFYLFKPEIIKTGDTIYCGVEVHHVRGNRPVTQRLKYFPEELGEEEYYDIIRVFVGDIASAGCTVVAVEYGKNVVPIDLKAQEHIPLFQPKDSILGFSQDLKFNVKEISTEENFFSKSSFYQQIIEKLKSSGSNMGVFVTDDITIYSVYLCDNRYLYISYIDKFSNGKIDTDKVYVITMMYDSVNLSLVKCGTELHPEYTAKSIQEAGKLIKQCLLG